MKRRGFLGAVGVLAGAAAAGAPQLVGTALAAPKAQGVSLTLLPADAAPLDGAGRRDLALDALTYFVRQQGVFPGRWVYQLPVPAWLGGYEGRSASVSWDVTVPGSAPIYLLAHAEEDGDLDPAGVTVTVDGTPLGGLGAYEDRVTALWGGRMRDVSVLGLVFAPPPAGSYRIDVKTVTGSESVATYRLTVQEPDSFGPMLLRESGGTLYAIAGNERRRLADAETRRALGYGAGDMLNTSAALIAALPQGEPVPALRDGTKIGLVGCASATGLRSASAPDAAPSLCLDPSAFTLRGGKRVQVSVAATPDPDVQSVDRLTLHSIPPELTDGMVLHGALPDVYQVNRLSLRKVPSWKWFEEKGITYGDVMYVPDRIIATLPQNSPHWEQPGGVWQDRTFFSEMLGRAMPYRLYLPDGYQTSGRRYPVIYLLHGQSGRYDEWSGYGVEMVANDLCSAGKLGAVIMVAPQGGLGYWMNQDGGALRGTQWGDYVAKDLVRHMDGAYRTIARRDARAIGGLSMGGHGALQLAMNYPETFGTAGAHSPSIRAEGSAPAFFGTGSFFLNRDPVSLVGRSEMKQPPRLWIDAGTNDPWRPAAEALHKALVEKGWPHEWRVFTGEHDGWYWGDHLWEYLPFYSGAFTAAGVSRNGM